MHRPPPGLHGQAWKGMALPPQIKTFPDPPLPQEAAVLQNQSHMPDEHSRTICSRPHQYQRRPPADTNS